MKKSILLLLMAVVSITIAAQEANTMWPYLFKDFTQGTIYTKGGFKFEREVNVHVLNSTLHYLDGNTIKETASDDLLMVDVADTIFMCLDGKIMQIVKGDTTGFVATLVLGDFSKVAESGAAYGASSNTQATMNLSSIDLGGINVINHMMLKDAKDSGKTIPLITSYYIVTDGAVYPANRNRIQKGLSREKRGEFRDFLKYNSINWKDPNDLMLLVDFLKD